MCIRDRRIGVDLVSPLKANLNMLWRLEQAYRFERQATNATGQILGLSGFQLPGQNYRPNWMRAAVGIEGKLGEGTGSLMLNATNQGGSPAYWLAASYRVDF